MKIYRVGKTGSINRHLTEALGFLVVPDEATKEAVFAAWSYAVRYTAKGLDVPDYEAAGKLLAQRHPKWQCFIGPEVEGVWYSGPHAEEDKPE